MARYTDDSREKVRDAVDFAEVVGARTELRQSGLRRMTGLCPFHEERTPSFGIDPVEKLYHCFGCGQGGDVFRFVMETEGLDFTAALEVLADRYRVPLERVEEDPRAAARRERRERLLALLERTAAWYVRMLWEAAEAAPAREYLLGRGLSEGALRSFRVGYAPKGWDKVLVASRRAGFSEEELVATGLVQRSREGRVYDRFRGRIMFPLADERGRVLGFGARLLAAGGGADGARPGPKYLNSPEGEVFSKGEIVYGFDLARAAAARAGSVVVCEGYTDVIALHQAGIEQTVAIMGTALTEAQAKRLAQLAPSVALCLDPDSAGREAMTKAASLLGGGRRELRVVALPAGRDPADIVAGDGADAMRALIDSAVPVARFSVDRALEQRDPDHALREAAGIIRPLAPSVLRDDLIRLVAGRLALSDSLVEAVLAGAPQRAGAGVGPGAVSGRRAPAGSSPAAGGSFRGTGPNGRSGFGGGTRGGRRGPSDGRGPGRRDGAGGRPSHFGGGRSSRGAPAGGGGAGAGGSADPGSSFDSSYYEALAGGEDAGAGASVVLGRREQAEVAFLALCIAQPEEGERRLETAESEGLLASPMVHRAAAHLRGRLRSPASGLPADDEPLARLVAELVIRAGEIDASSEALDLQELQLQLARLDRRIGDARGAGDGAAIGTLSAERQRVLDVLRHRMH